jgi:DNA polymerase elongation subunit (family B)
MILDFQYSAKKILISEIDDNGDIKMNYYPWRQPKKYVSCSSSDPDKHPKYTTWDRKPVKVVDTNVPNRFSIYEFLDRLPTDEKERLFAYKEPKIYFVDIETEILDSGFVEPVDANSKVLTIAIVHKNKTLVLGLKPLEQKEINRVKNNLENHFEKFNLKVDFKYISFHDRENPEKDMMEYFFEKLVPKMPVISGWNFLDYDWTFLINRCRKIGIKPEISSFSGRLEKIFGTPYEVPNHRLIIDYMEIYKKWDTSIKVKESNSLNWVGEKVLDLEHGAKIQYSGTLMDLYRDDFTKYVFYNAVDTVLVQLIHEKMQYINIAYSISNLAKIRLNDFAIKNLNCSLVITEGFLRENFREKENIVFTKEDEDVDAESIAGGWVKTPAKGMNEWVTTFDFSSLYPRTQMMFNIAPETFMGYVMKDKPTHCDFDGKITEIDDEKHIICVNGAVFNRGKSVTIDFLKSVFAERKRFKKMMGVELKKYDTMNRELNLMKEELKELQSQR